MISERVFILAPIFTFVQTFHSKACHTFCVICCTKGHAHMLIARCYATRRYIKRAKAPGSKLVELPSVFVDVTSPTTAATSSTAATTYDTMTIYSCVEKLGVTVTELILAGRTPAPPNPSSVEHMAQLARAQGAMWDPSAFHTVNRTNCK